MNINELREKRKALLDTMDSFLASREKDGVLSAEDDATYNSMQIDFENLTNSIHRLEKREAMEKEMNKATSTPLTSKPMTTEDEEAGVKSKAYKDAMIKAMRSKFHKVEDVLEEGTDANGGYLVPEEMEREIVNTLEDENVFRKIASSISTSGEHKINIAGDKPAAAWVDEGEKLTFDQEGTPFKQISLGAHKLHVAVKVTEELLYDEAFGLENYINTEFGKALANAEEDAFINGDGEGKPTGILHATLGGEVVKTASATALTADDIINLVYSLKRAYRKNAVFLINDATVALIRTMKDTTGAYIWQPSLQAGEPDRLLGYPVYTSTYMPTVDEEAKVIAFGDFSYYKIGDRGSRSIKTLNELFAENGMVGFIAKERVDGKVVIPEAIKVLQMAKVSG